MCSYVGRAMSRFASGRNHRFRRSVHANQQEPRLVGVARANVGWGRILPRINISFPEVNRAEDRADTDIVAKFKIITSNAGNHVKHIGTSGLWFSDIWAGEVKDIAGWENRPFSVWHQIQLPST